MGEGGDMVGAFGTAGVGEESLDMFNLFTTLLICPSKYPIIAILPSCLKMVPVNAGSAKKTTHFIHNLKVDGDVDLGCITKTWLWCQSVSALPPGFRLRHQPWEEGRRGRVAVVY